MGMKLQYNLENIGNIDKASITIKPLTIIAGENSSGKTFVTKSLYTILSHLYKDNFQLELLNIYNRIIIEVSENLEVSANSFNELGKEQLKIEELYNFFNKIMRILFSKNTTFSNKDILLKVEKEISSLFSKEIPSTIDKIFNDLLNSLNDKEKITLKIIKKELDRAFKTIFQITNLQYLIKDSNNKNIKLTLENICEVTINNKLNFSLENNTLMKTIDNVVFFDSPVYIKIRKALDKKLSLSDLNYDSRKNKDKYLKGYPEYIDDLYHHLDLEYIDTADFDEISQEIQKIISGKLDVSRSGDINYTDNQNNTIPLSLTAMGISNIGLIDLLLRNNVINKGSFLIMDEPEVHLHPAWQVILAQLLYKIAKSGANIIIATHSLDFLKAFENILKEENEIAEEIIAINKMPYDKSFSEKTELEKVGIVLDDLSRPFYDLYMQDI